MSETKIINVAFGKSRDATTSARYRYDYGQVIEVVGINLPETFEARFSNSPHGESIRVIGTQNKVDVPDGLFLTGEPIYCYITVHDEATDGRTMYSIKIPVKDSTERTDADPTPVEQDVITQAIASLNNAIDRTTENVEITNTNVELAQESAANAQSYAESANSYAENAQASANSANTYAENANDSATNAEASAVRVSDSETHVEQMVTEVEQIAQRAETASSNAESYASVTTQKANDASTSATNAQQSATNAQSYMNSALTSASQALVNAEKTQNDKEDVELAKASVITAVSEAQNYASSAQSASQAVQNMNVEAVTLEPNSDATVEKNIDSATGTVTLTYGIPKGSKGDKGDTGSKGDKGDSFVFSDFTPEQLASLKGEKGDKGDQGIQGIQGEQGIQGIRGIKGDTGAKGEKGDKGDKGDAGDDYILTQQDKEDIAGLVDTPVDDVQINGTSIVTDGVADIPIVINGGGLGVCKTNSSYGISARSDGTLMPVTASDAYIKTGINNFQCIKPATQHLSTFYGLAKASGHDEKDSTLPVGTYTEDAIIAIQKMLGVYQAPWELIEDFTLEEDDGFDKSAEPDGTPYNFRSAYVRITVPPNSTSIASGYGRWYFVDENNTMLTAESGRYTANTVQTCKTILIERNANMAMANLNAYTSTGGRAMIGYKNLSGISFNYGNIKRIYTNAQDKEPAGARIEIYAQRA